MLLEKSHISFSLSLPRNYTTAVRAIDFGDEELGQVVDMNANFARLTVSLGFQLGLYASDYDTYDCTS